LKLDWDLRSGSDGASFDRR
jgi:hypothetical protein